MKTKFCNLLSLFFLVLCGVGYGCSYTPPIQALLDWFPDKKGLASGIVIAGFGSGALFFSPVMSAFMDKFAVMPKYLGTAVETVTEGGKMFAKIGNLSKISIITFCLNFKVMN